jgi:hypothetical protein
MARINLPLTQLQHLPQHCVCCGQPATQQRQQTFRLNNAVSAATLAVSVMAGGLAWTERSITLSLPVCHTHRRQGRQSTRTLMWGVLLTGLCGGGSYVASLLEHPSSPFLAILAMCCLFGAMFAGMHEIDDGIRVKTITAESITIVGVHRVFADAVTETSLKQVQMFPMS